MSAKKPVWDVTPEEMDQRFSGGFQAAGGNSQSLAFMLSAAIRLTQSLDVFQQIHSFTFYPDTDTVAGKRVRIADYGCALGDGTAMLSAAFPLSQVCGYDISPEAIRRASERWPHLDFEVGDIRNPKAHDVAFASHVIEHMEFPAEVVQGLIDKHIITVVIVPPIESNKQRGEAHVDAKVTKQWLKLLPAPDLSIQYNTCRADLPAGKWSVIVEGNWLLVWIRNS